MLKSQNIPALIPGEAYSHFTRTQFDLSAMHLTFEQAKQAYAEDHYEEAVKLYTQVVADLQTDILSTVLLHRAAAHEMLQQYDQALQDSKSATGASSHVDGYLAEASAYYFQHKPGRAVATYKKALEQWPQHTLILQKHDQIIKEADEHNQWIARQLPYEILSRILSLGSIHDHIQLAKTCRFWYRFMMHEWPDMWNKIDARVDLPTRSPAIYQFLEQVPRYRVRKVILQFHAFEDDYERPLSLTPATFSDVEVEINMPTTLEGIIRTRRPGNRRSKGFVNDRSKVMFEWMLAKKWNCIETLELHNYGEAQLRRILTLSSNSLKELKLYECRNRQYEQHVVTDVSQICPDLQSLTCFGPTNGPFSFERLYVGNPRHSSTTILPRVPDLGLTKLVLSHTIPESQLAELLKKSPGLTSLKLYWESCELPRVVDAIRKHCPRLQSFAYGIQDLRTTIPLSQKCVPSGNGLQNLVLAADVPSKTETQWELFKQLGLLFQQCRTTLRALKLAGSLACAADYHLLTLLEHQGLQAVELKVPWDDNGSKRLSTFIAANPLLNSVCISAPYSLWNDMIITRLGGLAQLQHLSIHIKGNLAHRQQQHMSQHSIRNLFNHPLQDLTIRVSKKLPVPMRDALAIEVSRYCHEVQRLDIRGIMMSETALLEVLRNLKDSKVRQLILSSHGWPAGTESRIMDMLAAVPHISYLKIIDQRQMFHTCSLQYILRASVSSRFLAISIRHGNRVLIGCKHSDAEQQQNANEEHELNTIYDKMCQSDPCDFSASSADEEEVGLGQNMGSYLFENLFSSIIN